MGCQRLNHCTSKICSASDKANLSCVGELEASGTKASEAEAELASKHALIQSLEEDLLAAQRGATTAGEPYQHTIHTTQSLKASTLKDFCR